MGCLLTTNKEKTVRDIENILPVGTMSIVTAQLDHNNDIGERKHTREIHGFQSPRSIDYFTRSVKR